MSPPGPAPFSRRERPAKPALTREGVVTSSAVEQGVRRRAPRPGATGLRNTRTLPPSALVGEINRGGPRP